ncbi:Ddb1 and cul4-associated factor 17 [Plakobranchus ocellatus]|uniref:Ddb1 and cul4-associated factor 17 n=1 Tax=Plakobranchus ocellatus TaxID=259542 RepID=A0AAV4CVP1_9GAST|nr:Ddb1 and cul4-associated factor 17 [Plakobranchus ocellatus]
MQLFGKSNNICCSLVQREYSLPKSHRRSYRMISQLITKCDYTFKKVWSKSTNQLISCDGTLVFFKNYSQCVDWASMLALTKDNLLLRADIENGHVLEQIYLGSPPTSFKTLQWNVVAESVTLISKSLSNKRGQVRQEVFGSHAVDVSVFLDLLTVMYSSAHVRMYSMEWIIQEYKFHSQQLYEPVSDGARIALHADDSGRIVHMTNTQLKLLKLKQDEKKNVTQLVEDFIVTKNIEPKLPSLKVSQSGQILKQRVIPDSVDMPERVSLDNAIAENW